MPEGIDFFARYAQLPIPVSALPGHGRCPRCAGTGVVLFRVARGDLCQGCLSLTQHYPTADAEGRTLRVKASGKPSRLGVGEYLFLTPTRTVFYSGLRDFSQIVPQAVSLPATGLAEQLAAVLRTPPEEDWLFVGFGRSNDPHRLFVNHANEIIRLSGTLGLNRVAMDGLIALGRVHDLKRDFALSNDEWRAFLAARYLRLAAQYPKPKAAAQQVYSDLLAKYPALGDAALPPYQSPEAVLLGII